MEKLYQVSSTVTDVKRSLDWYQAKFDMETVYVQDPWGNSIEVIKING
jgi:catechol 2,3-dioxygenase-like lactoylglutathione lyase family enzyme